jgi:CRISPR-associated endoribonuclease Cas6
MIESFKGLAVARYEFRLVACEDTVCYPILGSTLRGAFGAALKDASCTIDHRNCHACVLSRACNYTSFFEPQIDKSAPRSFTFQIPIPPIARHLSIEDSLRLRIKKGAALEFGLTTFGTNALAKAPYVIHAVERMARTGFAMPRKRFRLHDVTNGGVTIFEAARPNLIQAQINHATLDALCKKRIDSLNVMDRLSIRFLTPVWIRENRQLVENPKFFHLVKFLIKRLKNVAAYYSAQPFDIDERELLDKSREIRIIHQDLWRHDFDFYSNRRHRRERQSGLLGEITIAGEGLDNFLPLLAAGEILHVGTKTSFGLGRYEIL